MTLPALYNAGAVRRWHTNPHMAHVVDTIDGHSGRVAKLILSEIHTLRGRDLCCWCKPGTPCHADVLMEIANG